MGLFSRKPKLSPEEILRRMDEIDGMIGRDEYRQAFAAAKELERFAPVHAAYFLGACYFKGWGVKQDTALAMSYLKKALDIDNEYLKDAYAMGGFALMDAEEHGEALDWLLKAEELGATGLDWHIATTCADLAIELCEMAPEVYGTEDYADLAETMGSFADAAQSRFLALAFSDPDEMSYTDYIVLGRCVQLLYTLSCRGEMGRDTAEEAANRDLIGNDFPDFPEGDDRRHLVAALYVCSVMDRYGWPIIGEYFRLACWLTDCDVHRSPEAFYRAKWHLKRIEELRARLDPELAEELDDTFEDLMDTYRAAENYFSSVIIDMAQAGMLPDISLSYPTGQAPAPESCAAFMRLYEKLRKG